MRRAVWLFGAAVALAGSTARAVDSEEPATDDIERKTIVERIDIRGLKKTRPSVIRDRLLIRAGEPLSDEKVVLSKLRLMGLGYFIDVKTRVERGSAPGRVVVVFELSERNSVVVSDIVLGVSRRTPIWAGLGIDETNFLGRGLRLGGSFVLGAGQQAYKLRFFEPALAQGKMVAGTTLYFSKGLEFFPDSTGALPELKYQRFGGTATFGFNLEGFHRLFVDYRLESVMARIPPGVVADIDPDLTWLSTLSFTYERDSRNDSFIPTEGWRIALGVEAGSRLIGSRYEFSKYTLKLDVFLPLVPNHAFKLDLFLGYAQGYAPFFDQFFFGDFVFFSPQERSIGRAMGLNYSDTSRYSQVALSAGIEYDLPLFLRGRSFHRGYLYFALNGTYMNRTLDALVYTPGKVGLSPFLLSFDVGLKLDTPFGNFVFSTAYILDLAL